MLTIRELIKTLYNALIQRMKKYRGNWEQNDPTADDYIKNRPFYTDDSKKVVIIPNQQITFSDNIAPLALSEIIEFVVGKSYEVKWDNVNYTCIAWDLDGLAVIGNQGMIGGPIDTGEPFIIMISEAEGIGAIQSLTATGTHAVEVTTSAKIVKIDKKYLPNFARVATSGSYDDLTDKPPFAIVAMSGSYNDLTNKPTIYNDVVRYNVGQSLTTAQKIQARANIGAADAEATSDAITQLTEQKADKSELERLNNPKDYIILIDQITDFKYRVAMRDGVLVSYAFIERITVTSAPAKTTYMAGEYFDSTGLVISSILSDGTIGGELSDFVVDEPYVNTYLTEDVTEIGISYTDESGEVYTTIVPITVTPFDPAVVLIDFEYTANDDGTYTIAGWKGTYNGESSTEMIIPNNGLIIV